MSEDKVILERLELGHPWQTKDPFLFCVHHLDHYPEGDEEMGPKASLQGRRIGQDFSGKDGWSMYHGDKVPGFPQHPHRGFETVTVARQGFIDHTDSLGASARFGRGDVQWMTAGKGIVHSEMFPLLNQDEDNPLELFQIWLNLPKKSKLVEPYFEMFWSEHIPHIRQTDDEGHVTDITIIAGSYEGASAPTPPPDSWAAQDEADVAIWTIEMEPGASWTLPAGQSELHRALYAFTGTSVRIAGERFDSKAGLAIRPDVDIELVNDGEQPAEFLLLQGRPLNEPVVQHGPFVMNTPGEIRQAMLDFQKTRFGRWPWDEDAPAHPRDQGRFAKHIDGRYEEP